MSSHTMSVATPWRIANTVKPAAIDDHRRLTTEPVGDHVGGQRADYQPDAGERRHPLGRVVDKLKALGRNSNAPAMLPVS